MKDIKPRNNTHKIRYFPKPKICQYCDSPVELKKYKGRFNYICSNKDCGARVGVAYGSLIPSGYLANKEIRELRYECHILSDSLWSNANERTQLYQNLGRTLHIENLHFGNLEKVDLERVIKLLKKIK